MIDWEDVRCSWRDYLHDFEDEVYTPVFQPRGYSRDAALIAFLINKLKNSLSDDNEEPWRE